MTTLHLHKIQLALVVNVKLVNFKIYIMNYHVYLHDLKAKKSELLHSCSDLEEAKNGARIAIKTLHDENLAGTKCVTIMDDDNIKDFEANSSGFYKDIITTIVLEGLKRKIKNLGGDVDDLPVNPKFAQIEVIESKK